MNPIREFLSNRGDLQPGGQPMDLSSCFEQDRKYIIVITGRCGSTWLQGLLRDIQKGNPEEFFALEHSAFFYDRVEAEGLEDFARKVSREFATGGCFGFQTNFQRFKWLGEIVDLRASFGDFTWIDMRRRDRIAQAVSYSLAKSSGEWHRYVNREPELPSAEPSPASASDAAIIGELRLIMQLERSSDAYYEKEGIRPLRIFYEDLLAAKEFTLYRVACAINGGPVADFRVPDDSTLRLSRPTTTHDEFIRRNWDTIHKICFENSPARTR